MLPHVLGGPSSKGVGRLLGISHRTDENHRAQAMAKFGASSTAELPRCALIAVPVS